MKLCNICSEVKDYSEFHTNQTCKDGYQTCCKPCGRKTSMQRYYRRKSEGKLSSDQATKLKAFEILGNQCAWCGFTDIRALNVDHVNGGGNKERQELRDRRKIHRKIVEGNTSDYQLLCANCNAIKSWDDNNYFDPALYIKV